MENARLKRCYLKINLPEEDRVLFLFLLFGVDVVVVSSANRSERERAVRLDGWLLFHSISVMLRYGLENIEMYKAFFSLPRARSQLGGSECIIQEAKM